MTVERRDHVLMTFLEFRSFCASTFFRRWSSMNGPFFRLRGMSSLPSSAALTVRVAAPDDQLVAGLVGPAGTTLGLAVGVHRVPAAGGLALAAAVRVVDRVHRHTTDARALALPAHAPRLTPVDVRLVGVADLPDGRPALHEYPPDFTGGHAQRRV